ncbi:MAG: rod shape-determining protein MreD [Actinobacteria bacterium]|nr:rod shape-determining protein MreD [Actinomycetota bacterium]
MKVSFRIFVVLFTAAVLYRGFFVQVPLFGVIANVLLLLAIAGGIVGGADRGAIVGFFAGLTYDLLVDNPIGLSALSFCLVGFVVGRYQATVVRSARWVSMSIAALASAGGMLLYIGIGQLVNQVNFLQRPVWPIIVVISAINGLLSPLAILIMRWAFDVSARDFRLVAR